MSQLENAVQPILRPVMKSERSLKSLTKAERHVVARWAAKTAYMLDQGGLEPRVALAHVEALYANAPHLPEGVFVFSRQQIRTRPWYYIVGAWWKHGQLTGDAQEKVEKSSYKIALQFGDLILIVVFWPLKRWGYRTGRNELFLLWPRTAVVKEYDHPDPPNISESDAACRRYSITISVVPHHGSQGFIPGLRATV